MMSKIPEGATHWSPENGSYWAAFWKDDGDNCWCYALDGRIQPEWVFHKGSKLPPRARPIAGHPAYIAPTPEWNGEGLPPIGVVCENVFPGDIWREVIIIAHDGDMAVFRLNNSDRLNYFGDTEQHFRPIRTPEQIAAEERAKALEEMQRAVDSGKHGPQITLQNTLMNLYDAGYRKTE